MDWSKGSEPSRSTIRYEGLSLPDHRQGVLPSAWERAGTMMSDAAGQQGSRLEVDPVLTVGHALLYARVGYEPIGTLFIFVHSVVHR